MGSQSVRWQKNGTKEIENLRSHVERVINMIKNYLILKKNIAHYSDAADWWDCLCTALCNKKCANSNLKRLRSQYVGIFMKILMVLS